MVRDLGVVIMLTSGTLSCSLLEARGLTVVLKQFSRRPAVQVAAFLALLAATVQRPQATRNLVFHRYFTGIPQAFGQ